MYANRYCNEVTLFAPTLTINKTSKKGLQRPAARYDGIGKIGWGGDVGDVEVVGVVEVVEVIGVV